MSGLRRVLWQRLNADLTRALGPDWTQKKCVIYGAGGLGLSFLQTFPQIPVAYAVDSDPAKKGETFHGMEVESPDALGAENPDDVLVFITSSWHQEIRLTLESLGLTLGRHFFFGNQQAHGRIFFHLPEMADFEKAFAWFEEKGVDYAILRWFETLPDETPADIDLLVRRDDLEQLFENPYLSSEPGGVPLEVYWSEPLGQEDELLYYPSWLAEEILGSRTKRDCGAYSPDDETYLKSLAYHAVFHKAERAKIPVDGGDRSVETESKYSRKIGELAAELDVELERTLEGLWSYLRSVDWLPPIDLARRYATDLGSPWLTEKLGPCSTREDDVLVFVLREWLLERSEVFDAVVGEIEKLGLDRVSLVEFDEDEKKRAYERIRGGNWVETEESRIGGGPAALLIMRDPNPERPSQQDRLLRPFCANRKLTEKTELKQRICRGFNDGRVVNFLHAADDAREGIEYIDCLAPARRARVRAALDEARR